MKRILLALAICFLCLASGQTKKKKSKNSTISAVTPTYPVLFRDHVYYQLSDKGKEAYYATNIHPDCVAKKGICIPRARCIGREMLYISRICYKRDLVCCYDNTIRFPETAWNAYVPPAPLNDTREVYIEPPVLP